MTIVFYPYEDDLKKSMDTGLDEKIEILLEAAERYKAYVLDIAHAAPLITAASSKHSVPSDLKVAYNWDGIALILREVRSLPEGNQNDKRMKSERLIKLAEVYEVLRASKMQKLEAVRLALVNEATHLRSGG